MEFIIGIFVIILFIITVKKTLLSFSSNHKISKKYKFIKKEIIMTRAEARFFEKLNNVSGDKFYILPQMHLSAFIDHKIKGQNWKAAFSTINGKSVDYLLVEKSTLKPVVAIELDDWSHQSEIRQDRDVKVAAILADAGVLLARFDRPNVSESEIIDKIYHLATADKSGNS